MGYSDRGNRIRLACLALSLALALTGLIGTAAAANEETARLERKVRVMERVLDEVLLQSPHVLVSSAGTTRGLILDEYGALFTLEVSLGVGRGGLALDHYALALGDYSKDLALLAEKEKEEKEKQAEASSKEKGDQEKLADHYTSLEKLGEEKKKEREKDLAAFQVELKDALLDYGPTLSELADTQWVTVVAYLGGRGLGLLGGEFLVTASESEVASNRLLLKVKMGDLRQYSAGRLSREEAARKIIIEEN